MKSVLFLAVALVGTAAHASHTVCSAPNLYFSSVRGDFGTQPPPGTPLGRLTIVSGGKVLVDRQDTQGHGHFGVEQYGVTFENDSTVLAKAGSQVSGSVVYRQTAVLRTQKPFPETEVLRTTVVCERTWALVP